MADVHEGLSTCRVLQNVRHAMAEFEMTFKDSDNNLIVIMPHVAERLLAHKQVKSDSAEAAGVIIGERRGNHLVIQHISEPGQDDRRSRYAVDRCSRIHQLEVDQAFYQSGGTFQYLGEWHTHPEDYPIPSPRDLKSWRKYLTDPEPMVLIIVGLSQIWVAKKAGSDIVPLTEIT